ncbi:hypothetical protein SNE25_20460 [Mucilaginibacter sabulilitoris]|uniref:Uncharacterized protein n=1 Tax=Mucilaginibacter sabulilitoris TaxID=1173583 RepID=A0ABZ0TES5_9SPHI|nr:hypothetical protein [Mucilaginibacter sabulilitoris]WPU91695.1 hypothetical protein SNE25_20460 [Mucilaginibacter sabulilitoris]
MKQNFIILLLALVTVACNSKLEDPDLVPDSEKLQITAKTAIASGGKDMTSIVVRVPKDAGALAVAFSSTAGSFIYSGTKTDKAYADSLSGDYRFAQTVLKSDTSHGNVYVTVGATTIQKRITIKFN